jgi:hypothetical protein
MATAFGSITLAVAPAAASLLGFPCVLCALSCGLGAGPFAGKDPFLAVLACAGLAPLVLLIFGGGALALGRAALVAAAGPVRATLRGADRLLLVFFTAFLLEVAAFAILFSLYFRLHSRNPGPRHGCDVAYACVAPTERRRHGFIGRVTDRSAFDAVPAA